MVFWLKILIKVSLALVFLLVGVLLLLNFMFSSLVEEHYASLDDARAAHLFGRGWLPDLLPPSSHQIHTANHLDSNRSMGHFFFSPKEYSLFSSRVQAYHLTQTRHLFSPTMIEDKRQDGFQILFYTKQDSSWIFFCKPQRGFCEYLAR